MPFIGAILHASVGTGPVKLFFPKDNVTNEDMRPISVGITPVNILD